jgi:hypothetical protein
VDGLGGNAVRIDGILVRMYTSKHLLKPSRIHPFTPRALPKTQLAYLYVITDMARVAIRLQLRQLKRNKPDLLVWRRYLMPY